MMKAFLLPNVCIRYDSVYPTRTARFGVALVPQGVLKLKNAEYSQDFR